MMRDKRNMDSLCDIVTELINLLFYNYYIENLFLLKI